MARFTYTEVKNIMKGTPATWIGKTPKEVSKCGWGLTQGYYQKNGANWCYEIVTVLDKNGCPYNVATVFGHIAYC